MMEITELIATHIIEVHEGGNWTDVDFKNTLADVDSREALTTTAASDNTIAKLLHHVSFYNDVAIQRLAGYDPVISESNGFDMRQITSEDDWAKLKERNLQSARQLAAAVRQFPIDKIFELNVTGRSTHYKTLHGIVEHAHYHLGQIVLLKNLIRRTKA